jgi:hypothetical protein
MIDRTQPKSAGQRAARIGQRMLHRWYHLRDEAV